MANIQRTNDVFAVDKTLTKHLRDFWGIPRPDWLTSKSYWWVVYSGQNWIGYSAFRIHDEESVYLGPTFVKAEHRGKGLQKILINKRVNMAKKMGFQKIITSTLMTAYSSSNNLIKCKFHLRPAWFELESETLYWQRDI